MVKNWKEYANAYTAQIEHRDNKMVIKNVLLIGFDDFDVIIEIIQQKYENCNVVVVAPKYITECLKLIEFKANVRYLNSIDNFDSFDDILIGNTKAKVYSLPNLS